ncbi:MAG TPA: helix-turn-helix transcriptional regulator [Thermomicrobiales bacterium]
MTRLSRPQEAARRQIANLAVEGHLPDELGRRLLAALAIAVPNDGQRLWTVDSASLILNRLVAASAGDEAFRLRWLKAFYLGPGTEAVPYFAPHELMRRGAVAVAYDERQDRMHGVPPSLCEPVPPEVHYRAYHDAATPAGGSLRLCLRAGSRWVGMLDTVRREARTPLAPTDFAFLRLVGPVVARALDGALAREQALLCQTACPEPGAAGVLLLTAERRIGFASAAAETWLGLLVDAEREGHAPLPTAVWTAVAALNDERGEPRCAAAVVAPTTAGPVRVEVSPAGEDGTIAVVLAPVRPPAPPAIPPAWPLTPRERRVVEVLLGGASNRRLAATLHVSEDTVETHLAHVYAKLDVRSRTELVGLLFRDAYLPVFVAEEAGTLRR